MFSFNNNIGAETIDFAPLRYYRTLTFQGGLCWCIIACGFYLGKVVGNGIFISYRRSDASADARSIYQRLCQTFGNDRVFMDVDSIGRGKDFRASIDAHLAECAAMLVVIGPNWLGASDEDNRSRLEDPDDFVRIEIGSALERNIVTIPVLTGGATLPNPKALPENLRSLAYRQAARISHENFSSDMQHIEKDLQGDAGLEWRTKLAFGGGAMALLACVFAVWYVISPSPDNDVRPDRPGSQPQTVTKRAFTTFEPNVDRPGGDYTSYRLSKADPIQCQTLCSQDKRCLAWTYVRPEFQEASAVCWLKNEIPEGQRTDSCCTSGVTYFRRPKN